MTTEFPARDSRVAVFGATGGVGQLVTGCLAAQNYQVTVVSRSAESARTALATVPGQEQLRFSPCDLVTATVQQLREIVADCSCIVLCTGTTAFPSAKWKGGNTPRAVDERATQRVLEAVAEAGAVCKVVLVTSVGTTRTKDFPFSFLNLFGVLDAKRAGEEALVRAGAEKGFQWVIVRPGRLIGGPYSNPDLAKLFKVASESGGEGGVKLEAGDGLLGDCSRDRLAACVTACVVNPVAGDVDFSIIDDDEREGLGRGGWGEELARLKEFTV